ncbi:MAG TPA: HEAT repeat domain-containing protein [Gemmataceae bacterium]|nr:HEAT repeat domain-containing protein [Gemmataceae bacterium]
MPCPVVIIEEPAKRERGLLSRLFRRNEPKLPIITGPPIVTSIQPVQPPTVVTPASPAPATKSTQSLPTTVVTPAAPAMTPTSPAKPASPATVMMPSRPTQAATAASPPRPPQTPPAVASASPAKPTVEPAQPKDWRQSWGKVETDDKTASPAKKTDTTSTSSTPKPATSSSPPRPLTAIKPETTRPVIPTTAATRADSTKAAPTRVPDLPRASTQKPDPLKEPGTYSRSPLPSASGTTTKPPITSVSKSGGSVVPTKMAAGTGKGDTTASSGHEHLPLGRGSVMAAGDVQFVPVPIVTMPNLTRMPQAPQPQVPQAPQPNQQVLLNAFSMAQGPPAPPKAGEMPNAFTPAIPVDESALGGGSAFSPPVPAYVGPMTGPMGPGMMPPHPAMMMARGMYPGAPVNPMMAGAMPAARPVPGAAPDVSQMLTTLRESVFPSQREWAADKLAACKWQTHPHVVEALVTALKDDPAATVRAACARSLAKMNANTVPVIGALQASKDDPDANVRREAEQALATLVPVRSPSAVQPAGGVMPTKP